MLHYMFDRFSYIFVLKNEWRVSCPSQSPYTSPFFREFRTLPNTTLKAWNKLGKNSNVETVKNICISTLADIFVEKKCINLSFCIYLSCTYTETYPHGGNVKLTYRLNMIIKTNLPVIISCRSIYLHAYIILFLPVPTHRRWVLTS